ncbi:MAG TPA: UDP-N-acetylmuramoylalanyl-D-glutamyl-2, 6-diaminopimelate--D-alanyl-D-alanine ligase, partial [Bacteroidetes bacterium]|nr:UDP-N-acetylmuramoylalanyl-D-glutamyl-2, 6-diaminopimelate--D-alanyl-D-alanine ligase [Bacteroidota bacterium]
VAFINLDEKYLEQLAAGVQWKIFYKKGSTPTSQRLPFEIQLLTEKPFISVAFATEQNTPIIVESNLIGYFNFNNIMTAIVVGIYFKVPAQKIKKAIENYVPANNRSQLIRIGTNTFLLDAYNANPSSMKKALLSFSKITAPNKIAILGAMKELGKYAPNEHSEIVELANHFDFQKIILVGEEYQGMGQQVFKDTGELKDWFEKQDFQNTYFLLKGSRSVGLEKLLPTGRV